MKKYLIMSVMVLLLIPCLVLNVSAIENSRIPNNIVLIKQGIKYYSHDAGLTWTKVVETKESRIPQKIRLQKTNGDVYMSYDAGMTWFKILDNKISNDNSAFSSIENLNSDNGDYLLTVYNLLGIKLQEEKINNLPEEPIKYVQENFLLSNGLYLIQIKGRYKNLIFKVLLTK
jgi:hypothetical protein